VLIAAFFSLVFFAMSHLWITVYHVPMVLRLTFIIATALLIALILIEQWMSVSIDMGRLRVSTAAQGITFTTWPIYTFNITLEGRGTDMPGFFSLPSVGTVGVSIHFVVLPWWTVLIAWTVAGVLLRRLLKRRVRRGGGFPVSQTKRADNK
jgi:hypothetical protein